MTGGSIAGEGLGEGCCVHQMHDVGQRHDPFRRLPSGAMRQLRWPFSGCLFLCVHAIGPKLCANGRMPHHKLWPCKPMHAAVFQSPCSA